MRVSGGFRNAAACVAAAKLALAAAPAVAACPQELAVYAERERSASLDFRPAPPTAAMHSVEFKVVFAQNGVMLDGLVLQSEEGDRPVGLIMHQCPEGDVTGAELAACTVWQGPVYAIDAEGKVGLMPKRGEAAAQQLLLPDFGPAVRHSTAYGPDGVSIVPWDVFEISGCQE
ncbi:hypothetical protein [Nitratireductor mangrovi]|uniref:hypothetical protein n=1 Tax=Nitratireductor mangrovi TaxID=2599600 RepID=UPI0011B17BE3|nr:hypothetical protein [Nitratireductor mangrovi]